MTSDSVRSPEFVLDMVHHNPGEPPFVTRYLDPLFLSDLGFNGQVFKHIHCIATFAAAGVDCFPEGSEEKEWLDAFTPGISDAIREAKSAGLRVFHHLDLFVLPRRLIDHFRDAVVDPVSGRISLERPMTLELHRVMFDELFERFPELDGFIIRVGETYLMDTPHHCGNGPLPRGGGPWSPVHGYPGVDSSAPAWGRAEADACVKLIRFLRDEICEKHGKTLIFRTWDIFPDRLHARADHYLDVVGRIDPHPLLLFSIKHTALDFWRRVKTNPCIGIGPHRQVIEVQCQREYEGKGAYPNYVMQGVIEGFEENREKHGLSDWLRDPLVAGVFNWSRGGGWYGPYLENEFWPDFHARVLAEFLRNPAAGEERAFFEVVSSRIGLAGGDALLFRKLCLLSATAVLKGRHCEAFDRCLDEALLPTACWMRDDRLGGGDQMALVLDRLMRDGTAEEALREKDEAVELWREIVSISDRIDWSDSPDGEFVCLSARYGLLLFSIVREGWRILLAARSGPPLADGLWESIARYDALWQEYRKLGDRPGCPSLYLGRYFNMPGAGPVDGLDASVRLIQATLSES